MPTPQQHNTWSVDRVRSTFIDFFVKKHAHVFVPSSPVVPHDDPTLLFTNAGMNQFKPIFLGQADPKSDLAKLKRAVNSQKCIRAGGKHNDLDDVGKDTYHHTFFEMLGNWSFGDYFKKEAVDWSWELLTGVYGLKPAALYATYFGGNTDAGLEPDLETKALWEQYLPPERVIPGNMKDNFWEMGETGPCGPCTEIHVDRLTAMGLENRVVADKVNASDPDVIEIWNNVFIQFNREALAGPALGGPAVPAGSSSTARTRLVPLPAKHVDTGMGLERITSILQNRRSNYDTDVFSPIFMEIERLTRARAYTGKLGSHDEGNIDTAYRVIADHIRTLTFAITDGATPSNEGCGYVLRRILRRAVRYGRQMLNAQSGFFTQLVPVVVRTFGDAFPELKKNPARVETIIREEEESFGKTLDRGIKLFDEAAQVAGREFALEEASLGNKTALAFAEAQGLRAGHNPAGTYPLGSDVDWNGYVGKRRPIVSSGNMFKLYDTYGFPPDLTQQMAEERGLKVDLEGFERLMEEQRNRARAAGKSGSGEAGAGQLTLGVDQTAQLAKLAVQPTDDSFKFAAKNMPARVEAIWNGENFDEHAGTGTVSIGHMIGLVLSRTNFYAEMGGQEYDTGRMHTIAARASSSGESESGEFRVESVQSFAGYVLHIGRMVKGEIRVGDELHLTVDRTRRSAIASNHTATHLLNVAIRNALGEGVDQKGSLVTPDRLRFDFTFNRPVAPEEIKAIEKGVRERVGAGLTVYAEAAPLSQSKAINGLRAVFGEKYPDPVRVVSIGVPLADLLNDPKSEFWHDISVEFCGGTHVASTHEIGNFALTSEEGIAKGIRRFTALTGVPALAAIKAADAVADRLREADKLSGEALASEAQQISVEIDQFTLPATRKHELRAVLAGLQDRVKQAQKESGAAKSQEASKKARQIAESAAASLSDIIINTIDIGGDRKALQSAVSTIQSICPKAAVMLFSPDETEGKLNIMAAVPPSVVKRGLSAGDWVKVAAEACGGKGGGKPDAAQGGGSDISKMKAAIDVATSFAHQKLGA